MERENIYYPLQPGTPKTFSVKFILLIEGYPSIEECSPSKYLNYIHKNSDIKPGETLVDHLRCCSMQGGYLITVDGKPWNSSGGIDEFWMSFSWMFALGRLLKSTDNPSKAKAGPWEESDLDLLR